MLHGIQTLLFTLISVLMLWIAKKIVDINSTLPDDKELYENNNTSLSMRHAGFMIAMGLALVGTRDGLNAVGFWPTVGQFLNYGAISLALLWVQSLLNNLILPIVNNDTAIFRDKNQAVGFIEMASYISSGLILAASFAGDGGGPISAIIFFCLGQFALFLIFGLIKATCGFNFSEEIMEKNMAVSVMMGSEMVSIALILAASILGPFESWGKDLLSFGEWAVIGVITMLVLRPVIDALLMPGTNQKTEISRDNNVAAAGIAAAAYLAVGIMVATSIL